MEALGQVSQTPRVDNGGIPSLGKVFTASGERYHKVPPIRYQNCEEGGETTHRSLHRLQPP